MTSTPHTGDVVAVAPLNRSHERLELLTGGVDHRLVLWQVDPRRKHDGSDEVVTIFPARHTSAVRAVAASSDGTSVYTGGGDRKVRAWGMGCGS